MKKHLLLSFLFLPLLCAAQTIPSYVPTTGLVGWWPFNGNANDESGNGNNGIVNGAILTTDINTNSNSAYYFDGVDDNIAVSSLNNLQYNPITYSFWFNPTALCVPQSNDCWSMMIGRDQFGNLNQGVFTTLNHNSNGTYNRLLYYTGGDDSRPDTTPLVNTWYHLVFTYDNTGAVNWYLNNTLISVDNLTINSNANIQFNIGSGGNRYYFNGKIDDIGIWNRVLTPGEVAGLYNGVICTSSITNQPGSQSVNISTNAQFTVASSDTAATFQWQTDLGVGFQNLNSVGQYSGTTTDTLTISNTTMSNDNQPFRCIITSGSCIDTSAVAILTVVNNVSVNELSSNTSISIYPNPANDKLSLSLNENFGVGTSIVIFDVVGSIVKTAPYQSEVSISELAPGSYTIQIVSATGNTTKASFVKQ